MFIIIISSYKLYRSPGAVEPGVSGPPPGPFCLFFFLCLFSIKFPMITCFSRLSEKYFSHQYCVCFHINHKCYIVSVVFRLITQSSSLYFHWFHVFKSSVFDLILNIVLEVDVWTLSKRFSQILVLLKSIYLVLFVLFVCVVFFI